MSTHELGPPESCKGLWYDPQVNRFKDEANKIINDLAEHFPTWQLDMWKRSKEYALLLDRNGELWEIFYEEPPKLTEECIHRCDMCKSRCEVWELFYEDIAEISYRIMEEVPCEGRYNNRRLEP